MAKIIELGFTDAQWELIQAYFMVFDIEQNKYDYL